MPYPEYRKEDTNDHLYINHFVLKFMVLAIAIKIPPLIKKIVQEKESGIKVCYHINFSIDCLNFHLNANQGFVYLI